jgi:hypothetical protein
MVRFSVRNESGFEIIQRDKWYGKTENSGWHQITAYAHEPTPYTVDVTYSAPQHL